MGHLLIAKERLVSVIDDLVALQNHDAIIRELEQQVKDIPLRKEQELGRLKTEQDALEAAQAAVKSVKLTIGQAELDIQQKNEAIVKLKQQQMTLKTNKEFAAMSVEIRQAEQALQHAEYDYAACMDRLEPAERAEQECQAKYDTASEAVNSYVAELDERLTQAESDLAQALEDRKALRTPLDVPESRRHLMYYERLSAKRWPAMVRINDGVCSGCLMNLPPAKAQAARRATDLVTCDFCGRMVY